MGEEEIQRGIDLAYLREAYKIAINCSDDLSTQNGAIIVRDNSTFRLEDNLLGVGANNLPKGVNKYDERMERPAKYDWMGHAERHAIYDAARRGNSTNNAVMYCPWFACAPCGDAIIESGLSEVIGYKKAFEWDNDGNKNKGEGQKDWNGSIGIAFEMFNEAGISYRIVDGNIANGRIRIKFKGKNRYL